MSDVTDVDFSLEGESAGASSEGSGAEHEVPEDDVAVARPPRSAATSAEIIVSGQAALDVLNQLQSSGVVGRERASNLRRRYLLLKETLESSRATETALLAQAKQLGQVLTQQQRVLEKGASFPDGESGEPARLRQILLTHSNHLEQSLQRLSVLNTHLASVEEEHEQVSKELDRLPRQADIDAQVASLNCQLEELRDEIKKRSKDIQHSTSEAASRRQRLTALLQDTEELKSTESTLQDELIAIRSAPGNLPREIDSIHKRCKDIKMQVSESCSHLDSLASQQQELQCHREALEVELRESRKRLEEAQAEGNRLHDLQRQADSSLAQAKERQTGLLEQQASLQLTLRHRGMEHGRLYEQSASLSKDIERTARQVKKMELVAESVKESQCQLEHRAADLQAKASDGEMAGRERKRRQNEIREEVDNLRKGLSMQDGVSSAQRAVLTERQREEERVRVRVSALTDKLQQLNKETVALTRQRDIESRACHQARLAELATQANQCTQEAQFQEQRKTLAHLQLQLTEFAQAYKIIKTGRNHTHSNIQKLQQLSSEMKEKWRVLENEAEVLTSTAQDKEKLLQRCALVQSVKSMERDGERQNASKLALEASQTKSELEAERETLSTLAHQLSSLEYQLNQLRKNYEHALQERNDAGLQLIERNEEVCVFHERLNMQEAVLRQANLDLMAREEEMRYLNMEVAQLKTQILVSRKSLPEQSHLQHELTSAQIQLRECEGELRALESQVENAQDPARVRLLPGPQPSQEELSSQLECLEERLAGLEQAGLERELLHEQVCRLADRANARATTHKQSTLEVAQRVSQYQSKIKDTTRKTMALVSELTMQQANALRLHREVREREREVERAYTHLQTGQPPNEDIEQQWLQLLREEQQQPRKRELAEDGEGMSTAEQRPNAYLPTGDTDLPIPKPYGSHAPFKPSPAGANMRHIRRPQLKPIDI